MSSGSTETIDVAEPTHRLDELWGDVGRVAGRGRYVVLEEVGRGAMGRVLRAYDPKLQREVALKEVRRSRLGSEGTARLVAEARAMAKLSHPNVVAVFDVEVLAPEGSEGADSDAVMAEELALVMEYVPGTTLKGWLREQERGWNEIVARYVEAGRGLAAAHAAGLLHRDFKPANVLIRASGHEVQVKVTDFGLATGHGDGSDSGLSASIEDAEDSAERRIGQIGSGVAGTPRYMAPEQHRPGRGSSTMDSPLSPAVDQYAFCVALWEALHGASPFSGSSMVTKKREGPPPWSNAAVPRVVAEAIQRGLSPDPGHRWPNMDALLEVLAYDPAKRRSRWLVALSVAAVTGAGAMGFASWSRERAKRCSGAAQRLAGVWDDPRRAEVEAAVTGAGILHAEGVWAWTASTLDEYTDAWTQMHTETCEATTVRGEQSEALMDLRMACLQRAKVELKAAIGVLATADADVVHRAHKVVGNLRPLGRCADVETLQAGVEPPAPRDAHAVERARSLLAEAKAERNAGRYKSVKKKIELAKEALIGVGYEPVRAELAFEEGEVLETLGAYEAAVEVLQFGVEVGARSRQWDLVANTLAKLTYVVGQRQQRTAKGMRLAAMARRFARDPASEAAVSSSVASILSRQGRYGESEAEFRRALEIRETVNGTDHPLTARLRNNIASCLKDQGKYEEAEAEHRRVLALREKIPGLAPADLAESRNNLATVLNAQGKYEEAESEHRRALEIWSHTLGTEHPQVAMSRANLANVLMARGEYESAETEHRQALTLLEKALGPDHGSVAQLRNNLAIALKSQGRYEEAEAEYRRALALWSKTVGPEHPNVAATRSNLAVVLAEQNKHEEAETEHRAALVLLEKALGPEHPSVASARINLAYALAAHGNLRDAEAEYRRAAAPLEKALGPDHFDLARCRLGLAEILQAHNRAKEALEFAEQAWSRLQRDDVEAETRAATALVLARALWESGDDATRRGRARDLARRARQEYRDAGSVKKLEEVESWLESHR